MTKISLCSVRHHRWLLSHQPTIINPCLAGLAVALIASLTGSLTMSFVVGQENGGNNNFPGGIIYRRVDGTTCKTLQTIPGNEQNIHTVETGLSSFMKYEDCERTCTELGMACLGFEYQVLRQQQQVQQQLDQAAGTNDREEEEAQCNFWSRRPIDFQPIVVNNSSNLIETSTCVVKDFHLYEGKACGNGFISRSVTSLTRLVNVSSVNECHNECDVVSSERIPIFEFTTTSGNCYGFLYNFSSGECLLYDTPFFELRSFIGNESMEGSNVQKASQKNILEEEDDDYTVCFVRSQTISPSSLPRQESFGSCQRAFNSTVVTSFPDGKPPADLYTFNPATSGSSSCVDCDCIDSTVANRRYIWIRLLFDQKFRDSLTLDSYQPAVKWTVEVAQNGANLGAAILQAEGCDAVTNCIGGAETAISAVSTIRTSPGFYTLAAGGKSGPSELYAIISTDRYEYEDLSSTTDADLGGRSLNREGSNARFRQLQESLGIPVDYFVSGIEALKTNLMFEDLQISLTLAIDPRCHDDQKCIEDIDTVTDTTTSEEGQVSLSFSGDSTLPIVCSNGSCIEAKAIEVRPFELNVAAFSEADASTDEPTTELTEAPTDQSTEQPTEEPTEQPTDTPTDFPTPNPSLASTSEPPNTNAPSAEPVQAITDRPTESPTTLSQAPTTKEPTDMPTDVPTPTPSHAPTTPVPTISSTVSPTIFPTTGTPTAAPTPTPSNVPTTPVPTISPTVSPTFFPTTDAPTAAPTFLEGLSFCPSSLQEDSAGWYLDNVEDTDAATCETECVTNFCSVPSGVCSYWFQTNGDCQCFGCGNFVTGSSDCPPPLVEGIFLTSLRDADFTDVSTCQTYCESECSPACSFIFQPSGECDCVECLAPTPDPTPAPTL